MDIWTECFLLFCSFNFGIIFGTGAHNPFLSVYCISTHFDNSDIFKSSLVFHINHCNLWELSVCMYVCHCWIKSIWYYSLNWFNFLCLKHIKYLEQIVLLWLHPLVMMCSRYNMTELHAVPHHNMLIPS